MRLPDFRKLIWLAAVISALSLPGLSCSKTSGTSADDRISAKKVEAAKKSGGVDGLRAYFFGKDSTGAGRTKALEEIIKTPGPEAERVLLEFANGPEGQAREMAIRGLVERKSAIVVPILLSRLLNKLQTGEKGDEEAAAINSIDPGALKKARESMIDKANQAKRDGSTLAAKQFLENAQALSPFVDNKDLSSEKASLEEAKKVEITREQVVALLKAMDNGQLTRMYYVATLLAEKPDTAGLRALLPEIERLSRLEDRFYSVAKALESAKSAYEEARKKGVAGVELAKLKANFDTQKGNMILARRELERERQKLPALSEKVRLIILKN